MDIGRKDLGAASACANIALENGNLGSDFLRDASREKGTTPMTAEQIAKAKALSKEMIKNNPKLIKKEE